MLWPQENCLYLHLIMTDTDISSRVWHRLDIIGQPIIEWALIISAKDVYSQVQLQALIDSGRYDTRDDFTVVIQPFLRDSVLPYTDDGQVDATYFAPDCFHFSDIGHAMSALNLWNNMVTTVCTSEVIKMSDICCFPAGTCRRKIHGLGNHGFESPNFCEGSNFDIWYRFLY